MPRFLFEVSFSTEGARGIAKEGGTARRDFIEKLTGNLGGKLLSFDFAFGETDLYVIADLPDNATAAALSLAVASSGAGSVNTVVLITAEEFDKATKTQTGYRPPGG
jgi:uncharacterized protein with GYD domain